jgi:hypothetical protein
MFIDEARSLALAPHEDIIAEAETLEEAVTRRYQTGAAND